MKSNLAQFEKRLSKHTLELVEQGEKLTAYYLRPPEGGRMMSTLITFTPEGITLQGDITPSRNGNVSVMGYGVRWFAGQLSDAYLCEKFLDKRWVREIAADHLANPITHFCLESGNPEIEKLREIGRELGDVHGEEWLHEELQMLDGEYCYGGVPGYFYDPNEMAWLVAIQRRFALLYRTHAAAVCRRTRLRKCWLPFSRASRRPLLGCPSIGRRFAVRPTIRPSSSPAVS